MHPGAQIKATALLTGTVFESAVIFIHQYDEQGAVGFITNRLFPRRLNELLEFASARPLPIYEGGPVDTEHLFFLHYRPDMITGGRQVDDATWFGGDFQLAIRLVDEGRISADDISIFIGYCGWDKGELEAEIDEGSWEFF